MGEAELGQIDVGNRRRTGYSGIPRLYLLANLRLVESDEAIAGTAARARMTRRIIICAITLMSNKQRIGNYGT